MNRTRPLCRSGRSSHHHRRTVGHSGRRPAHPGEPIASRVDDWNCPLRRIDTQLVRCDNLTGAGVPASVWVPEL